MAGGGGFLAPILEIAAAVALPGLGELIAPALGGLTGLAAGEGLLTASDALAGAALGAGTSAITGGNVAEGAGLGAVGGAVEGSGALKSVGDAVGSAASDVGNAIGDVGSSIGNSLGLTGDAGSAGASAATTATTDSLGGIPTTPTSSVGATGSAAAASGIDNLADTDIGQALNNSGSGSAISGTGSIAGGGSVSAPSSTISPTSSLLATGGASSDLESGGGYSWDSAINSSLPSSNASSANLISSGSSLQAGGGLQASTGVAPVADNNFFSDITSGNFGAAGSDALHAISNIPVKALGGIAGTAYQALAGQPQLPKAQKQLEEGLANTEQQQLAQFNAGQVSPSQQAALDKQLQDANNATYQQFAAMGITNPQSDTRFIQALQNNQAQIEAQKNQMLQQTFSNVKDTGSQIAALGETQQKEDAAYDTQINEASKALFEILGS